MRKNVFKIVTVILILLLAKEIFMIILSNHENNKMVMSYYKNDTSFNYKDDMLIKIPSINLERVVKKADKNFTGLNKSLLYYKNNDYEGKIIIFGHSGMGYGTYFNRIDELSKKDELYLYKNDKEIHYKFQKKYSILKTDKEVLKDNEKSVLLIITCDKKDKEKRLVVKFTKNDFKTLKK